MTHGMSSSTIFPSKCSQKVPPPTPPPAPLPDYNDHFETSSAAVKDIEPLLYKLARMAGKPKEELVVYDPF